jgi:acyl carrier protein
MTKQEISEYIVSQLAKYTKQPKENFPLNGKISNFRIDSIVAVTLVADLEKILKTELAPNLLWEFKTLDDLTNWLYEQINS